MKTTKVFLACALVAMAWPLHAQANDSPDAVLLRRADSLMVGDYCKIAQRLLADATVLNAMGSDTTRAHASAGVICNPLLAPFSLRALVDGRPAPLRAVARLNQNTYAEAQIAVFDAMTEFRAASARPAVNSIAKTSLGADSTEFVRLRETANGLVTRGARDRSLQRLANYERKLGPTSARLNFAEVILNYSAQRWIWFMKPTAVRGPSPWEVVASYAPGYVTFASGNATPIPVSASEFGVRRYLFGEHFGKSGVAGVLLPTYWSAGMLTASDKNGALVWPWQGRDRSGAYFSWAR